MFSKIEYIPINNEEKEALITYEAFNIFGIIYGILILVSSFFWLIYIVPYNVFLACLLGIFYIFFILWLMSKTEMYIQMVFIKLYLFFKDFFTQKFNNIKDFSEQKFNDFNAFNNEKYKPQKHTQTTQVYERNQELKNICINRAGFQCEIDNNHKSFISSKQHNYVEAHHIIPLSFQDKFIVNLDTLENLISLCPVCHKAIHQGNREEKLKVLKQIYNIRKPFNISFDDLLKLYLSN